MLQRRLILAALILIITLLMPTMKLEAKDIVWVELSDSIEGKQWWDKDSLRVISPEKLTVESGYLAGNFANNKGEEIIYTMSIDCKGNMYRDISINGIVNALNKWQSPKGDILIKAVINQTCKEIRS